MAGTTQMQSRAMSCQCNVASRALSAGSSISAENGIAEFNGCSKCAHSAVRMNQSLVSIASAASQPCQTVVR
jgi:hypothetical protein